MDGIGGLVIGHLFKIPSDLLPRGYGSDTTGGKLIQTITSISHKVANGDWTTTIDALNIVTNDSSGGIDPKFNDLLTEGKNNFTINVPQPGVGDIPSLSGDWKNRAFQVITIWEGFEPTAVPDAGTLRGGYGSDKKLVNGKPQQVVASTTFTRAEAKDTLIYLIENDYGPNRVIRSLGKATFDSLNDNQRAALISYAYNVGNINKLVSSIKSKDFTTTAALIKAGPITSKGVVVDGLVIRRAKEALVFSKPV
jgi:GH24 family phage-related lysozyme (muramidase)